MLEAVRKDKTTRSLPVVVVSTSDRPEDVNRSYELGANAYVTKPADYDVLTARLRSLHDFWGKQPSCPRKTMPCEGGGPPDEIRPVGGD